MTVGKSCQNGQKLINLAKRCLNLAKLRKDIKSCQNQPKWPPEVGVEQNRKQRFPVNSITSKLVLKSIYASGSTGPFFDNHFMNKHDSSFAKKTDFLSRYLVLSEIRCARKKSNQKQEQNLLSKVFNLFEIFEIAEQEFLLDSLLSA